MSFSLARGSLAPNEVHLDDLIDPLSALVAQWLEP
jgi:hypothetical protein